MSGNYAKSRVEEIELAIDELAGTTNKVLRMFAATRAALFGNPFAPELDRKFSC